jgi:hypothetical protein
MTNPQPRPWQQRRETYLTGKDKAQHTNPPESCPEKSIAKIRRPAVDRFSDEQRVEIVRHLLTLSRRGRLAGVLYCDDFVLRLAALHPIGPIHFRRLSWFQAYWLIKDHPELCTLSFKILDRKPR